MRIKVLLTALVLLAAFQLSKSQPAAFAGQQGVNARPSPKVLCKCVPRCQAGYFCEQFDGGGCGCTPI